MKDNIRVILGTVAAIAVVAVAGLLVAQAIDGDDEFAHTPIALTNGETVTTPDGDLSDADDAAQLDNGLVVDADDVPLSSSELARAEAAALRIAGGGVVADIDRSDDLGEAYEVEVVGDAGDIDIALNDRFERVANLRYDD
jgi:hypothetical protein